MPRFIAFLRAINVGGRTVKMDQLRGIFESMGFSGVESFIASGNVVFDTRSNNAHALEKRIAVVLKDELGYDVATFLRTNVELSRIAGYKPFPKAALEAAAALQIAFLASAPGVDSIQRLVKLKTAVDDLHVHGREAYWLCRKKQSGSVFSNAVLEKTLEMSSTMRSVSTVTKMAARYGA